MTALRRVLSLVVCWAALGMSPAVGAERPNVLLFLVDDLGWMDLGCQGSDYYKTPNIDDLAESGIRFTNAYAACAVCSPTRAAILTGRYPARLMLTQWLPAGRWSATGNRMKEGRFLRSLPLEEVTLAEALRVEGYKTFHVGKWHLGGEPFSMPRHHGFDKNVGGDDHGAPGSFFFPFRGEWTIPTTTESVAKQAFEGGQEGDFLTDLLAEEAGRLIRSAGASPFFLYLPFYGVHAPLEGKKDKVERYAAVPKSERQGNPKYAAMVESIDDAVGHVMGVLEEIGEKDNTLIVFTSDNGGLARATNHEPLRANKGSHYEGGIRVPLIMAGAGIEPVAPDGVDLPVISCDLYPTILALTQSPVRESDGLNLGPLLTGVGDTSMPADRPLFWHYPHYNQHPSSAPISIIRRGPWKLIEFLESGEMELYHLGEDLGESRDLSVEKPHLTAQLFKQLAAWKEEVGADPMKPNPQYEGKESDE
ncbi:MAG: sulfatase [Verrucomicrobiota bacterium]